MYPQHIRTMSRDSLRTPIWQIKQANPLQYQYVYLNVCAHSHAHSGALPGRPDIVHTWHKMYNRLETWAVCDVPLEFMNCPLWWNKKPKGSQMRTIWYAFRGHIGSLLATETTGPTSTVLKQHFCLQVIDHPFHWNDFNLSFSSVTEQAYK